MLLLRRITAWALLVVLVFGQLADVAYAQVVPDGRTATVVATDGPVTDVTTGTVFNQTGVNSFDTFNVTAGNVVNLHLPNGTSALVNLVHGSATEIDGMLNSIQNGAIGGKVYFLNPHGVVVGPTGTINVGSLSLMTPTADFMNSFFDFGGNFQPAVLDQVVGGNVPITPSGNISIAGTINARTDVRVAAGNATVDGKVLSGAVFQHSQPDFSDVVNINGLDRNPEVTFENGIVRIQAQDTVTVKGSIAVHGNGSIDAGDIELTAGRNIRLDQGAQLLAQAGSGSQEGGSGTPAAGGGAKAGDVTLTVSQTDDDKRPVYSQVQAETGIVLDGATVKAGNIALIARSRADNSWTPDDPRDLGRSAVSLVGGVMLENVNVIGARAKSEVVVQGSSVLTADGRIRLSADSSAGTGLVSLSTSSDGLKVADLGFVYGELDARAEVRVGEGVRISAKELDLSAYNAARLDVSVHTVSSDRDLDAAVAVTKAAVASQATIAPGAVLTVSDSVPIRAVNENAFSTGATALSLGTGQGGIAVAYFHGETEAVASLEADMGNVQQVAVEAADMTSRDRIGASTSAGSNVVVRELDTSLDKTSMGRLLDELMGRSLDERSGATQQPKLASAVTVTTSKHKAWANVGDGVTIDAQRGLVVSAEVEHGGIQNHAESAVESPGKNDPRNPDATKGFSAAVAYGSYGQDAQAWIGAGASVSAANVGLRSRAAVPYQVTWHKWEGLSTITDKINGNLGVANGFLTGFSNSTGNFTELGLAGSVSYLTFDGTSLAYVGRGATVNIKPGGAASWTTELPSSGLLSGSRTVAWDAPVAISASSEAGLVSGVGHLSLTFQAIGSDNPDAVALGGAYGQVDVSTDTRAFVSAGAKLVPVKSDPPSGPSSDLSSAVSISAVSREQLYLIAPTAGRGSGYGISGNFALTRLHTVTEASVDRTASVTAEHLRLHAEDTVLSWAIAGGLSKAQKADVGAGIAVQEVTTETRAFIGDNGTAGEKSFEQGTVRVHGLSVTARTDGKIENVSVAGAVAGTEPPPSPKDSPTAAKRADQRLEQGIEMTTFRTGEAQANLEELADDVSLDEETQLPDARPVDGGEKGKKPLFGFGISGSVSYNNVTLTTKSFVTGAHVIITPQPDSTAKPDGGQLAVEAVSDTHVRAFSGAAAILLTHAGESLDVALAGAAAVNEIANTVEARVADSRVQGAQEMSVTALAGGDQLAIGIGAAYNGPGDADRALTVAGSVSVSLAHNTVRAALERLEEVSDSDGDDGEADGGGGNGGGSGNGDGDGTGDGSGESLGQVVVTAYNRIRIQAGAGSLAFGGHGGVGVTSRQVV